MITSYFVVDDFMQVHTPIKSRRKLEKYSICHNFIKEARAGCGLKNRLREFFLISAHVIFMVFRVYLCAKNHTSP